MNVAGWGFIVSGARWLIYCKEDASKKLRQQGF